MKDVDYLSMQAGGLLLAQHSETLCRTRYGQRGNEWAKLIEQGTKVEVGIKIKYDGDALRPSSFEISYKIGNDKFNKLITNN